MAPLGPVSDGPIFALSALQLLEYHLRDTANIIRLWAYERALQQGGAEEHGQIVQDATLFPFPIGPLSKI